MRHWWCMNCDAEVKLGKHGRCECCGSEAVHSVPVNSEANRVDAKLQRSTDQAPA